MYILYIYSASLQQTAYDLSTTLEPSDQTEYHYPAWVELGFPRYTRARIKVPEKAFSKSEGGRFSVIYN